jgi:hypothetical protein
VFFDRKVSKSVCSRVLRKIGWSWKVPTNFQLAKYSLKNVARYLSFIEWIQGVVDWSKLKFCDEAHIVPQKIGNQKVLGLVNKRVYTKDATLHQASSSISIITSLDVHQAISLFVDYQEESNTQWDFVEFVLTACEKGFLQKRTNPNNFANIVERIL